MELFKQLLENPLYIILFGSGGILAIIVAIIALRNKKENGISISIDINGDKKDSNNDLNTSEAKNEEYILEFETNPIVDKTEEYDYLDFTSEEYYVAFLKTIEEKKKAGDKVEYK